MRYRLSTALIIGLLFAVPVGASAEWDKRMVMGSSGPVMEIRASRSNPSVQQVANVPQTPDPQARQMQLQEQLLKMTAMLPKPDFTDYKVGPEDTLQITFLDTDKLNTLTRVNGQGEIRLLLVGDVKVVGLSTTEIARKLTQLYREGGYLTSPQIMVTVQEYRHQKVAVTGAVNKPDHYALIGPRSLLEVLGMAGGLSEKAGETVNVMRPKNGSSPQQGVAAETIIVDLNSLLMKGMLDLNIPIQNGDVVFVPFARSAIVMGAVTRPGNVLLQDNMTVTKAISQVQGPDIKIASSAVTVLRVDENGVRQTIPLDIKQIVKGKQEDVRLRPNDIVYVHESSARKFLYDFKLFLPGSVFGPGMVP